MSELPRRTTWLTAIREAANQRQIPLPRFTQAGMGSALCRSQNASRFVSFKRRLVNANEARNDGVHWTLWLEEHDVPSIVATFREPLVPTPDRVAATLSILQGWLIGDWTVEKAQQAAATQENPCV